MFLFIAFGGTQIAQGIVPAADPSVLKTQDSGAEIGKLLFIAFAFGAGLAINVAVFADISGGMFNPAVCSFMPFCRMSC
jgi:aquaporin related protein